MNRLGQVKIKAGPVAALLIVLLIVGVSMVTPKLKSWYEARKQADRDEQAIEASASAEFKKAITIAGDPWSGYFIFRSAKFRNLMAHAKIRYKYQTEEDLKDRFQGLASGKYQMVCATVDGYTLNGLASKYPGVIAWVIDESYGGDAIVGGPKLQSLDDIDRMEQLPRIAFAQSYPSEHLLNAMLLQFHKTVKKVPVKSSEAAFEKLKAGTVDGAVLWEPETSNAAGLIPGSKVLISTRDMVDFIIDVVIVSRQLILDDPDLAEQVALNYFSSLRFYEGSQVKMVEDIAKDAGVDHGTGKKIQAGIRFVNLPDNAAHWFGVGGPNASEKMSRIIQETVLIQKEVLPPGTLDDPFFILNRTVLERTLNSGAGGPLSRKFKVTPTAPQATPIQRKAFPALTEEKWRSARSVGTLDVAPIYFSSGSAQLGERDRKLIDQVGSKMIHYPNYRLVVAGHSSPGGDPEASRTLSLDRARSVQGYLTSSHGLDTNRVHPRGLGGSEPLPRKPKEPGRAWRSRCQRVEFILVNTD